MDSGNGARLVRWSAWLAVIGLLLVVFPVGYFTAAPGECVQCHEMTSGQQASGTLAHEAVDCTTCHAGSTLTERTRFAFYQTFGMQVTLVSVRDSVISSVPDTTCIGCHDGLGAITESRGLRILHDTCGEGSRCVSCHSPVAHPDAVRWPTTYAMERCLDCHGAREAARSCETCHAGRITQLIPATGTFPVTHGPNWESTHGMGEMSTCSTCHADDFCGKCHGLGVPHSPRFVSLHGPVAKSPTSKCLSCHKTPMCESCHVYEMPHPLSFTESHSEIVATDGEEQCRYCHDPRDCVTCHDMHVHPGGAGPLGSIRGDSR